MTIADGAAETLFQYGALGVIALAFLALVYIVMRQGFKDRAMFVKFLIDKDAQQTQVLSQLSENIAAQTTATQQGYSRLARSFREVQQTLRGIQETNAKFAAYLSKVEIRGDKQIEEQSQLIEELHEATRPIKQLLDSEHDHEGEAL